MFKFVIPSLAIILTIDFTLGGTCWDTGCQLDSWRVRGCAQYGLSETGKKRCTDDNSSTGIIYSCCSGSSPTPAPAPAPGGGGTKYGDATFYNLGMTACGQVYSDSDMVAAIAFSYFTTANPNNDPMCGRQARVTDPTSGKSVVVTIRDKCGGCTYGDIDMSPSAFQQLRPLSTGRFKVQWNFI